MSRHRHNRPKSDCSDSTDASKEAEKFSDVALVVGGKTILANAGILAYNSMILGNMISSARKHRGIREENFDDEVETRVAKDTARHRDPDLVEVELKDQSYGTVRTLMTVIQTKYNKADSLSGETALQILPLTETFKMKRLRKICAAAMLEELESMRRGERVGSIQTSVVLKYLAAADKHNIESVKAVCVEECGVNFGVARRKEVVDDKHISEKTKVAIMDKMCDCMSASCDKKIQTLKEEMETRSQDIEQRRQKYMEENEEWRRKFQKEVDDMITTKQYQPLYENLLEQIRETEEQIAEIKKEMTILREQVTSAIQPIEDICTVEPEEGKEVPAINESVLLVVRELRKTVEKSYKVSTENIAKVTKNANEYFDQATKNFDVGLFQNELAESYELHSKLDDLSTDLDDKMQEVGGIQALYEQEKIQHEKTKAQLRKQMKKVHQINTWVKWAKPVEDDEKRCQCFRHGAQKKLLHT